MQSQRHRGVPVFLISTVMFLALLAAFQAGYIIAALVALPLTDRMDTRYVIAGGGPLFLVMLRRLPQSSQLCGGRG
ncbi:MAG: hypothetical protein IBX71_05120 [Candidatus Desulforudis sp.]|nr:hypothetical protein [Desulforudis sp.]